MPARFAIQHAGITGKRKLSKLPAHVLLQQGHPTWLGGAGLQQPLHLQRRQQLLGGLLLRLLLRQRLQLAGVAARLLQQRQQLARIQDLALQGTNPQSSRSGIIGFFLPNLSPPAGTNAMRDGQTGDTSSR